MKLVQTEEGFALYKEKTLAGRCAFRQEGDCTCLSLLWIDPAWRRRGYGSYLLRQVLHRLGGYAADTASCFAAPLPQEAGEEAFWAKFGFRPEAGRLVRRRKPDLTAVRLAQEFLAARLQSPRLLVDATCGNGGDTAFLCRLAGEEGQVLAFDIQPAALKATAARLEREGIPARRCRLVLDSHANLLNYLQPGSADGVMFNFGWLPGADHAVHSSAGTSIPRAGGGPPGAAPRRRPLRGAVQRRGDRGHRKAGGPLLAAHAAPGAVHGIDLQLCQLGRQCAPALLCAEKNSPKLRFSSCVPGRFGVI